VKPEFMDKNTWIRGAGRLRDEERRSKVKG
jgi:hypothetical protein